jgi:hypothetical protein
MADMVETVVGMAEPALRMVGRLVQELRESVQRVVNNAVAEALAASGVNSSGATAQAAAAAAPPAPVAASGPTVQAVPSARVRPLRAPGR